MNYYVNYQQCWQICLQLDQFCESCRLLLSAGNTDRIVLVLNEHSYKIVRSVMTKLSFATSTIHNQIIVDNYEEFCQNCYWKLFTNRSGTIIAVGNTNRSAQLLLVTTSRSSRIVVGSNWQVWQLFQRPNKHFSNKIKFTVMLTQVLWSCSWHNNRWHTVVLLSFVWL